MINQNADGAVRVLGISRNGTRRQGRFCFLKEDAMHLDSPEMNPQTILLSIGLAVAVIVVVKRVAAGPPDVLKTLRHFRSDPKWTEKIFHRELRAYLETSLRAGPLQKMMTEAGVTGTTARVDVHAVYGQTDYLITVKKGLSAQKVKSLVGEVTQILTHWRRTNGRKTVVVVMLYDEERSGGDDHVHALMSSVQAVQAMRHDVSIECIASLPLR